MTIGPESKTQDTSEEFSRGPAAICRAVIIGHPARREFAGLARWLCQYQPIRVTREFADIETALESPDHLDAAELAIVLQSWSDQYPARAIDQLIGRTLFHRLLCCYGPWCESDGRTRSLWPDAVRVSVGLARSVIEQESRRALAQFPPIPPTSARDEIFAHRLDYDTNISAFRSQQVNAAIIGSDPVFRETVTSTLQDFGLGTVSLPLFNVSGETEIRPQETSHGTIHVVLHDLDPWSITVRKSLDTARLTFPSAKVLGLATMPDAGLTTEIFDEHFDEIIPKLDMHHGLKWHLQHVLTPPPH